MTLWFSDDKINQCRFPLEGQKVRAERWCAERDRSESPLDVLGMRENTLKSFVDVRPGFVLRKCQEGGTPSRRAVMVEGGW
jgi:hypothetical protein